MKLFTKKGSQSAPEISFDPRTKTIELRGYSYPENINKLYRPMFMWLKNFLKKFEEPLTFNFKLLYLNTGSTRFMLTLINYMTEQYLKGKSIKINWFYHSENEMIQETGLMFKEQGSIPFNLIEETPALH